MQPFAKNTTLNSGNQPASERHINDQLAGKSLIEKAGLRL